ncbi:MAG: glycerate kinase [Clostridia bacterium]
MKVVIAIDSFKGSCTSKEAGEAVARGIHQALPDAEALILPVADGGEGTVDAILACGGERKTCVVSDPLGGKVTASYGVLPKGVAVMEMSAASGLLLVPPERRDALRASTYGTGEMIRAALDGGYRRFLIGLGGSATTDGGAGMAQALGASLRDCDGRELPCGGMALEKLHHIDVSRLDPRLKACDFTCAVDVQNTLCGAKGAAAVYGPQKGVTPEMVQPLDQALFNYAAVVRRDLGIELLSLAGGGAAGGLGAGLFAFANAAFEPGIDAVLNILDFERKLAGADLVMTGEGRMDSQTASGKVPVGIARRVKATGKIPVFALVGGASAEADAVYQHGIDGIFPIADGPITMEESCARVKELLARTAEALTRGCVAIRRQLLQENKE